MPQARQPLSRVAKKIIKVESIKWPIHTKQDHKKSGQRRSKRHPIQPASVKAATPVKLMDRSFALQFLNQLPRKQANDRKDAKMQP